MAEEESKEVEATEEDAAGEEQEEEKEEGKKKGPNLKKPLIMVAVILVQVALAYSVAQFVILPRLPGSEAESDSTEVVVEEEIAPKERGIIIMMDDIVVNLKDGEDSRFLKVSTGLEFADKKLEQEISERMPELRDLLIDHLSNHEVEDMVHRQGREVVKQQVLEDFNNTLQAGNLLNIYFSDFVVQ